MKLTGALQENVLALLCFSDASAPIVAHTVEPRLFENAIYRTIAEVAVEYIDRFGAPPKTHLPDLLDSEIREAEKSKAQLFKQVLHNLFFIHEEGFNEEYIMHTLRAFIREQNLKIGVTEAAKLLQEGRAEEAEEALTSSMKKRDEVFDPGISFTDPASITSLLHPDPLETPYRTGITALDMMDVGPVRGEMMLLLATTNKGKTWWATHLGKMCLLQRARVLHISLEMGERQIMRRYLQSLYSIARKKHRVMGNKVAITKLGVGDEYEYMGMLHSVIKRPALFEEEGRELVQKRLVEKKQYRRLKLIVKYFPTHSLTVSGLSGYLDMLDRHYHFTPDVLILDYPDLMYIDPAMLRVDTGSTYKQLRGIAGERNCALIAPAQSNRMGEDARVITNKHMAEDYSKAGTADTVISYNQTPVEKELDLARLFVAKARNEEAGFTIAISQSYRIGQFHLSSALLRGETSAYWGDVESATFANEEEEDGEEENKRASSKKRSRKLPTTKPGRARLDKKRTGSSALKRAAVNRKRGSRKKR